MMSFIRDIEEAKHIVLVATTNPDSLCSASAFYSYLMRLQKKVTIYIDTKELPQNLSFVPWFEKIKNTFPASADFVICFGVQNTTKEIMACGKTLNIDNSLENSNYGTYNLVDLNSISISQVVFDFLESQKVAINQKMATALYGGLLSGSENFLKVNGTSFAFASKMIECGAEHKKSIENIARFCTLATVRLKARMLLKMQLKLNGTFACFVIDENDYKESGANKSHAKDILKEVLYLPTVTHAIMIENYKEKKINVKLLTREDNRIKEWIEEHKTLSKIIEDIEG